MEIQRYLNGKQISKQELSLLAAVTPELERAVRAVQKRAEAEQTVLSPIPIPSETHG